MRIELNEDDGVFFGGTPKNIVVTVTMDDGKKVKFPYSASKSMASLYKDIRKFCPQAPAVTIDDEPQFPFVKRDISQDKHLVISDPKKIEREDIVSCIHLEKRESLLMRAIQEKI